MIQVACAVCGSGIPRWPYQIRENKTGSFYCSRECESANKRTGHVTKTGYRKPQIRGDRTFEHRRVMEKHIGRKLLPHEVIHHINGDKLDNRISNLLLTTQSHHVREHKPLSFDIESAESLLREGVHLNEVSQRFNVRQHTIREALRRRGLRVNALRGVPTGLRLRLNLEEISKLAKEGRSIDEIAQAVGCERHAVTRFLRRHDTSIAALR